MHFYMYDSDQKIKEKIKKDHSYMNESNLIIFNNLKIVKFFLNHNLLK